MIGKLLSFLCQHLNDLIESYQIWLAKVLDCDIVLSEFEFQSRYYIHFPVNTLGKTLDSLMIPGLVGWDWKYDTKQSDRKAPVMVELYEIRSIS